MSECHECHPGTTHVNSKAAAPRISSVLQSLVDVALKDGRGVVSSFTSKGFNGPSHGQPESLALERGSESSATGASLVAVPCREVSATLTPMLHAAALTGESLAEQALSRQDFSFATCLKVLEGTHFQTKYHSRSVVQGVDKGCFAFGVYSYGRFFGVTRSVLQLPSFTRYINSFRKAHGAMHPWSSLSINRNTSIAPHKDPNNLKGSVNQSLSLGSFSGGELWLQASVDSPHDCLRSQAITLPSGSKVAGHVICTRHRIVSFSPDLLHATLPWTGCRWSVTCYLNRGFQHITAEHIDLLLQHNFPLPAVSASASFTAAESSNANADLHDLCLEDLLEPVLLSSSYPTEQALSRKAKLKAGHTVQPKHKLVEQWHDDLGEDLSSLSSVVDLVTWDPYLLGSVLENPANTVSHHANDDFVYHYLCANDSWLHASESSCSVGQALNPHAFLAFVTSRRTWVSALHVCEFFGGVDGTSYLSAKMHDVATGLNFDVVCAFALSLPEHVRLLWHYLHIAAPVVVLMAPSSSSSPFGSRLQRLCAAIARFQLAHQRHFVLTQPAGSPMLALPQFQSLTSDYALVHITFDQCMTGLRMLTFPFLPIRKRTQMWASAPIILARLSNFQCDGRHQHASCSNTGRCWSYQQCRSLAAGISDLILTKQQHYFVVCPGCKGHLRKDDPKHTRTGDCKFPTVEPSDWTCKACKANRPRADKDHTLGPDCKWAIARTMPEGASRERHGHHPRDPRVPASRDPTADLRLDAPEVGTREASSGSGLPRDEHGRAIPAPRPFRRHGASAQSGVSRRDAETQAEVAGPVQAEAAAAVPAASPAARPEVPAADGAAAAAADEEPPWSRFDLGRAMQQLRSLREGVVLRALRQLHIRWYHCPSSKMKDLLQAAGASPEVLAVVQRVVDTCSICRAWSRPSPKSVATTSLPTKFNEVVEADLLFYKSFVILHVIDKCTRFTVTSLLANRETDTVMEQLHKHWIALLGPPGVIVSDQEGAFTSPVCAEYLDKKGNNCIKA